MVRYLLALAAGLVLLAGCGGGTTLSGTFTETMYDTPGSHAACSAQEPRQDPAIWKVRVAADNVTVGTAPVSWTGNAASGACRATWSLGVPAAQKAYQVTLIAACADGSAERIAAATVQPSAAGNPVRLSDAAAGGNNC